MKSGIFPQLQSNHNQQKAAILQFLLLIHIHLDILTLNGNKYQTSNEEMPVTHNKLNYLLFNTHLFELFQKGRRKQFSMHVFHFFSNITKRTHIVQLQFNRLIVFVSAWINIKSCGIQLILSISSFIFPVFQGEPQGEEKCRLM